MSNSSAAEVIEMPRSRSIVHPVGDGVALRLLAADRAGQLDRAGVEQRLLGEGRLAGVGVGDDGEGPPPRHFPRDRI